MKVNCTNPVGSTRVARVQFGVALNCIGAREFQFNRMSKSKRGPAPVSGATPETTRRRRVLPTAIEDFHQA
jgi:hypothetical protein